LDTNHYTFWGYHNHIYGVAIIDGIEFFASSYRLMEKQIRDIGLQLRALRKAAGYSSYADFAWAHDLPKTQYGRMENGANCTFKSLQKVLDIHGLSLQDFFSLIPESKLTSTQKTP
jgi:hypothetical protein